MNLVENTGNMFNGMFGKIAPGMCRLSMNGRTAIKTSNGYKVYDVKTGRLTNCNSFVFDIGEDFFFVIPTNKVAVGDIILASGKPRAVMGVEKNAINTFCYEDSSIETIVPEHHVFMGNTYFYGKIVSLFGNSFDKKTGMESMMKYMMMSEMMKGNADTGSNSMLPMMMFMNGGMGDMFENMFDFDIESNDDDASEEEEM